MNVVTPDCWVLFEFHYLLGVLHDAVRLRVSLGSSLRSCFITVGRFPIKAVLDSNKEFSIILRPGILTCPTQNSSLLERAMISFTYLLNMNFFFMVRPKVFKADGKFTSIKPQITSFFNVQSVAVYCHGKCFVVGLLHY